MNDKEQIKKQLEFLENEYKHRIYAIIQKLDERDREILVMHCEECLDVIQDFYHGMD